MKITGELQNASAAGRASHRPSGHATVQQMLPLGVQKGPVALCKYASGPRLATGTAKPSTPVQATWVALILATHSGLFRSCRITDGILHLGRLRRAFAEMNPMLEMQTSFQAGFAQPPNLSPVAETKLHSFRGSVGDTYGDTLYRTLVQYPATRCKIVLLYIAFILNSLYR